ncbi:MAG: hypothetical protein CVV45_21315 [Spirochaetae bacterium HGW-Spirochaetae-10]|nr:MAG: hypothetical protein CVV45_21315 [Spirochaetae bacterium HGW-Spirochaetae-10]
MDLLRKEKNTKVFIFTLDQKAKHTNLWASGALYFSPDPQEKSIHPAVIANAGDLWRVAIPCKRMVEIEYGAETFTCDGERVVAKDPFTFEPAKPVASLEKGKRYMITWRGGGSAHGTKSYFFVAE